MILLFTVLGLLLMWGSRKHKKRYHLWVVEVLFLFGTYLYITDLHWGQVTNHLPWRVYIDSSASMSWGKRFPQAIGLTNRKQTVVYFDNQVHAQKPDPIGVSTDLSCVLSDWETKKEQFAGIVIISDGVTPLPTNVTTPVNTVWMNEPGLSHAPTLTVPDSINVGETLTAVTDADAQIWAFGVEHPTKDGKAEWVVNTPSNISVFAKRGNDIVEKKVKVYATDTAYVLRILVGVDPTIPVVREVLTPLRIEPLQWNGAVWHWEGKTYTTPLLSKWITNAAWLWLDAHSWNRLPKPIQTEILALWKQNSIGVYWAGTESSPWDSSLPGIPGVKRAWGFKTSEWGPTLWTESAQLEKLTSGAIHPGAGLAMHSVGQHRIVQHTGTNWHIALNRETQAFWKNTSEWLIEGHRPIAEISLATPRLNTPTKVQLQIRDKELQQLRLLVTELATNTTTVISISPKSLQEWTGNWVPRKPGLYRVTALGHGVTEWTTETITNVPSSTDEYWNGREPDAQTLMTLALSSNGSFQVNTLDEHTLVPTNTGNQPHRLRNYGWGLGLLTLLLLLSVYWRLNYYHDR